MSADSANLTRAQLAWASVEKKCPRCEQVVPASTGYCTECWPEVEHDAQG